MDYKKLATEIIRLIGGQGNIKSYTNCMTRLRVSVKDKSKIDAGSIKALKGVIGIMDGEAFQIIVGPGHAQRLKDAVEEITGIKSDATVEDDFNSVADATKAKIKASQTHMFQRALKHVGNVFIPIIPGFVGCGLIMAITNVWKLADPAITGNQWFAAFAAIGGLVGGLLHIIIGYNSSKEFGGSPILGAIAGAFIYSPALNGIAATADAPAKLLTIPLFGVGVRSALGGVLGVILAAFVFAWIEKRVRKFVPAALDLFLVPFITIIIGSIITLFIIMPISAIIMQGITFVLVDLALRQWGAFGGFLLSALFLPLVMLGLHQGLTPIHTELINTVGYTVLLPILACAGAGQVGMAIAVYLKTKNPKLKGLISNALPIGILGIGEPLIYGVSLPLFYPFITACLGAGFGGALIGFATSVIGDVGATAVGPSGVVLIPLIANGMWLWYLMGLVAAYAGGFVLTYFFGFKESMLERLK
ncbi:MAG: PTS transporter subunit EIIC [Clostridiales bacterium]|jgi:PTS system sucrose-specific IIC component|nr:PTS transporter subunit EIIC [Clostridiales bacterium]